MTTDRTPVDVRAVFSAVDAEPSAEFTEALLARLRDELAGDPATARQAGAPPLVDAAEPAAEPLAEPLTIGSAPAGSACHRHVRSRRRVAALAAAGTVAVAGLVAAVAVVVAGGSGSGDGAPATTGPAPVELAWGGRADRGWPAPTAEATVLDSVLVGRNSIGGPGPHAIAYGEDEGLWLTAADAEGPWRAVRLDPLTGEVLAEVAVPGDPPLVRSEHGLALSGGDVWVPVAGLAGGLFRIDAASGEGALVPIEGGVAGSAVSAGDGSVWAAAAGRLYRVSAEDAEVVATAPLPEMGDAREQGAQSTELAYDGTTLWVDVGGAGGRRHLLGVDPHTLQRRTHALLPGVGDTSSPFDVVATGDGLVVACLGPGNTFVIDPAGPRMLASRFAPTDAVSADGDRVWAASSDSPEVGRPARLLPGSLVALDPATGAVLASVEVPIGVHELVPVGDGTYWATSPRTGSAVHLRLPDAP